jgi:transglutaminase-like putative cysteine protease
MPHFTLLLVALPRARGIPARARVGFGTYFEPGQFLDHRVAEWWNERAAAAPGSGVRSAGEAG